MIAFLVPSVWRLKMTTRNLFFVMSISIRRHVLSHPSVLGLASLFIVHIFSCMRFMLCMGVLMGFTVDQMARAVSRRCFLSFMHTSIVRSLMFLFGGLLLCWPVCSLPMLSLFLKVGWQRLFFLVSVVLSPQRLAVVSMIRMDMELPLVFDWLCYFISVHALIGIVRFVLSEGLIMGSLLGLMVIMRI